MTNIPYFLIIGAQKCGTTSLYNYLLDHPQIVSATTKEVHFFDFNFAQGWDWYLRHFPAPVGGGKFITGEASPYYLFHPLVPERVGGLLPRVKLIVLLRNPAERAWSHYHHEVRLGFESLPFEEAMDAETARLAGEVEKMRLDAHYYSYNHQHYTYLARGIYVEQLQRWMELFPRNQFLILKTEDLEANPEAVVSETLKFLGLPEAQGGVKVRYNAGAYPQMSDRWRQKLGEYFRSHNQRLEEYLGLNFDWS